MKLNNTKNMLLAKKGVYAEQLYFYSKLCQTYQELAEETQKTHNLTPQEIEKRYSKPLARIIASTDLDETLESLSRETRFTDEYMGKMYSQREIDYFHKFADYSNIFKTFQEVSHFLDTASSEDTRNPDVVLDKMHKYMTNSNRPKTVQNFDKLLSNHSPRFLGSRFFLLATNGIKNINAVDRQHIPLDYSVKIQNGLTPQSFGALISGYKTLVKDIEDLEEGKPSAKHYDSENWDLSENIDYIGEPNGPYSKHDISRRNITQNRIREAHDDFSSVKGSFKENAYVAGSVVGNAVSKFYTSHKKALQKAVLIAAGVATLIGGAHQVQKEVAASHLDITSSTQYEQTIQDSTRDYLFSIMEDLQLQNASFDPQYEDVSKIEENIDLVLDRIVSDQATKAFEEYHEGYKVTEVSTWFNKRFQGSPSSEPQDYQFVDISYIDAEGKEGVESIHNLNSDFLTTNPLKELFAVEENIDLNSPVWNAFHDDGTKNFLEKAQNIEDVMEYLEDAVKVARRAAAFNLEHGHNLVTGEPYLKTVLPNEKNDLSIDDDDAR